MKLEKLHSGIYYVTHPSVEYISEAFIRLQEYYESPKFRGQVFSLEKFSKWYTEEYGDFTYYLDWGGFNIPSYVVEVFKKGVFDPLSEKEKELLAILPDPSARYYVIAGLKGDQKTKEHEVCHALFYLKGNYKQAVTRELKQYETKLKALYYHLESMGYHNHVIPDEMNAYLVTESEYLQDHGVIYPKALQNSLKNLYKNEIKKLTKETKVFTKESDRLIQGET